MVERVPPAAPVALDVWLAGVEGLPFKLCYVDPDGYRLWFTTPVGHEPDECLYAGATPVEAIAWLRERGAAVYLPVVEGAP